MRTMRIEGVLSVMALLALVGFPSGANATVIIKTFHVAICVTGEKHPDACKKVPADGRLVGSEEAMEWLDGKIGEGATIEAVTNKPAAPSSGGQGHRHHHDDTQTQQ
jgi:hypothetical protein